MGNHDSYSDSCNTRAATIALSAASADRSKDRRVPKSTNTFVYVPYGTLVGKRHLMVLPGHLI
jgi:hypothetical protein